jgi:hypothetical protein
MNIRLALKTVAVRRGYCVLQGTHDLKVNRNTYRPHAPAAIGTLCKGGAIVTQ